MKWIKEVQQLMSKKEANREEPIQAGRGEREVGGARQKKPEI